jgi:hypothetical protein
MDSLKVSLFARARHTLPLYDLWLATPETALLPPWIPHAIRVWMQEESMRESVFPEARSEPVEEVTLE